MGTCRSPGMYQKILPRGANRRRRLGAVWVPTAIHRASGAIGFLIQAANMLIPAHYHGSIIGLAGFIPGLAGNTCGLQHRQTVRA